jgi:hypothetical protein
LRAYTIIYASKGDPSRFGFTSGSANGSDDARLTVPRASGEMTFVGMAMYFFPGSSGCVRPC